jgi:predicted MFS family arabinose efflux permease
LAWNNSSLFLGIALGSLVGGQFVARGSFALALLIAAAIALIGSLVNWMVIPSRRQPEPTAMSR